MPRISDRNTAHLTQLMRPENEKGKQLKQAQNAASKQRLKGCNARIGMHIIQGPVAGSRTLGIQYTAVRPMKQYVRHADTK